MTSHIRVRHTFDDPAEKLVAALRDPEFHDAKVRFVGASGSRLLSLEPAKDDVNVIVEQLVLRSELPGIARRFAGREMRARREEWWSLSPIYSTGEFEVEVPGAPMRAASAITPGTRSRNAS